MVWDDPGSLGVIQDPLGCYGEIWEVTKQVLKSGFLELSSGNPRSSQNVLETIIAIPIINSNVKVP